MREMSLYPSELLPGDLVRAGSATGLMLVVALRHVPLSQRSDRHVLVYGVWTGETAEHRWYDNVRWQAFRP